MLAGAAITSADLAALWEIDAVAWIRDLRADTLELMRALKARGRRLGILTNMSPDFHERLFVPRAAAYRELVDAEVVSGLERRLEAELPVHEVIAPGTALPTERAPFCDGAATYVEAARAYGWKAEVYPPPR